MVAYSKKDHSLVTSLLLAGVLVSVLVASVESFSTAPSIARKHRFVPSSTIHGRCTSGKFDSASALLAAKSGGGKKKRRRRKRKTEDATPPAKTSLPEPPAPPAAVTPSVAVDAPPVSLSSESPLEFDSGDFEDGDFEDEEFNIDEIKGVADFSFDGKIASSAPTIDDKVATALPSVVEEQDGSVPLPDIRDTLKRKKMGETPEKGLEDNMPKTKIDRGDRKALLKVRTRNFICANCFFPLVYRSQSSYGMNLRWETTSYTQPAVFSL